MRDLQIPACLDEVCDTLQNIIALPVPYQDRFLDFLIFRKLLILAIFRWELGSGRVCNREKMAVGFKWTDSQPISSHLNPFPTIFMISIILVSIPVV